MSSLLLTGVLLPLFPILLIIAVLRIYCQKRRISGSFAFFHPYCDAGGGGERVLWLAINAMQTRFAKSHPTLAFVIYTGDVERSPDQILSKVHSRFGIAVQSDRLHFVHLRWRSLLEAQHYPRLTLLAQMFAGLLLGGEALWRHCPQWFIDTTGCPLTLPLFRWIGGANTLCYVHYPTITSEMIQLVDSRTATYNNSPLIAGSLLLSSAKVLYYRLLSLIYRVCGNSSQLTMVNGSWTADHIASLWGCQPHIIHPPCDVETLAKLEQKSEEALAKGSPVLILSIGQIRPEKNHLEQLRIFADVRRQLKERGSSVKTKLVIAGGCRNESDWDRVSFLKKYALGNFQLHSGDAIESDDDVIWRLNIPFAELSTLLSEALIGLHTMWNEHFGISVVESMAAGLLMVAHDSGGPKRDIINNGTDAHQQRCGFLANTKEEYVMAILQILALDRAERDTIRAEARQRVKRFSDGMFERNFCEAIEPILSQPQWDSELM